jgi:hypothetical protein
MVERLERASHAQRMQPLLEEQVGKARVSGAPDNFDYFRKIDNRGTGAAQLQA